MSQMFALNQSLRSIVWPTQNKLIKEIALVIFGAILLGVAAQFVIPMQPVPLTFQSAAVIFIGMVYGARLGAITVVTYLLAGGLGLPMFAEMSSGFGPFMGATAGYLLGFVPAAMLGGFLIQKGFGRNILTAFIAAMLSAVVIFFFGVAVLSKSIGFDQAIALGVMPFLVTEPLKLLAIAFVVPRFWK